MISHWKKTLNHLNVLIRNVGKMEDESMQESVESKQDNDKFNYNEIVDFLFFMLNGATAATTHLEKDFEEQQYNSVIYDREMIQIVFEENDRNIYKTLDKLLQGKRDSQLDNEVIDLITPEMSQQSTCVDIVQKRGAYSGKKSTKKNKKKAKDKKKSEKRHKREELIRQLSDIFPKIPADYIESTLVACDGDAQAAFELLSTSTSFAAVEAANKKRREEKKKKFRNADELFGAKLGHVANQWEKTLSSKSYDKVSSANAKSGTKTQKTDDEFVEIPIAPSTIEFDLAVQLKLEKLKSVFSNSGIPEDVLKNIFIRCNYRISESIQKLNALYPDINDPSKRVKNVVAPQVAHLLSNQSKADSTNSTNMNDHERKDDNETIDLRSYITNENDPYNSSFYRRAGVEFAKLRNQLFSMAVQAYMRGDGATAKELSRKGQMADLASKRAHMNASREIFENLNHHTMDSNFTLGTVDLHGLHVKEAIDILEQVLASEMAEKYKDENRVRTLNIITGLGRHSTKGIAKLRPAVHDFLNHRGYSVREPFPGILQIKLK
jgi:hypothetical protein